MHFLRRAVTFGFGKAMSSFSLELLTPERILWTGEASAATMRTDGGEIAFLANHASFIGALDITVLRIAAGVAGDGDDRATVSSGGPDDAIRSADTGETGAGTSVSSDQVLAAVHGGFVLVDGNRVSILAGVAELAAQVDVDRARRALTEAEDRIANEGTESSNGRDGGHDVAEQAVRPPEVGAFIDPSSPVAAVARARVRLEAAGVEP